MTIWAQSDLYGSSGATQKSEKPSTAEQVSAGKAVERGASMSWLTIVLLFFAFRMAYEMAGGDI